MNGSFCDVEGCTKQGKYLRVIKANDDFDITFNVCEEHEKVNWQIKYKTEVLSAASKQA